LIGRLIINAIDSKRINRGLSKGIKHKNLTILILGASVTLGIGLEDEKDAWPNEMQQYLTKLLGFNVLVRNKAIRAAASNTQAEMLTYKKSKVIGAHLVIVDISVNDRPCHRDIKNGAKVIAKGAVMRTSNVTVDSVDTEVERVKKVETEGRLLMQALLSLAPPDTGVLYYETFVSGGR
jgi:lysophospholipase L1-like esterase